MKVGQLRVGQQIVLSKHEFTATQIDNVKNRIRVVLTGTNRTCVLVHKPDHVLEKEHADN